MYPRTLWQAFWLSWRWCLGGHFPPSRARSRSIVILAIHTRVRPWNSQNWYWDSRCTVVMYSYRVCPLLDCSNHNNWKWIITQGPVSVTSAPTLAVASKSVNDELNRSIGRRACCGWFHRTDCFMEVVSWGSCNRFWDHTLTISL